MPVVSPNQQCQSTEWRTSLTEEIYSVVNMHHYCYCCCQYYYYDQDYNYFWFLINWPIFREISLGLVPQSPPNAPVGTDDARLLETRCLSGLSLCCSTSNSPPPLTLFRSSPLILFTMSILLTKMPLPLPEGVDRLGPPK